MFCAATDAAHDKDLQTKRAGDLFPYLRHDPMVPCLDGSIKHVDEKVHYLRLLQAPNATTSDDAKKTRGRLKLELYRKREPLVTARLKELSLSSPGLTVLLNEETMGFSLNRGSMEFMRWIFELDKCKTLKLIG